MSLLWALFAPVCVLLYTMVLPIGPNDFWYHARAGRQIWESGAIPHTALFSYAVGWTTPHTAYFYQSWFADVLMYLLLRVGGLSGIEIARSLLSVLASGLLGWAGWRRAQRVLPAGDETSLARWVCGGVLIGFGMCALNLDTRPQMFSVPLFAGFLAALWEWPYLDTRARFRLGALLCALMAIWSNTHGGFINGLMLVVAVTGGETLFFLFRRSRPSPVLSLWILVAALCGAAMLNQQGAGIFTYAWSLSHNPTGRRYIAEWQPPHVSAGEWYNGVFFASFALVPFLAWRAQQHGREGRLLTSPVRAGEWAALFLLGALGCQMTRAVIWYGLTVVPIVAPLGVAAFGHRAKSAIPTARGAAYINAVLAVFLLLLVVPLLPGIKAQWPWPHEFRARFAPNPPQHFPLGFAGGPLLLLDKATPVEAVEFLRGHPPRGHLWNDMVFGSYLTWALAPRIKPTCCPRVELYPTAFWNEYGRLIRGPAYAAKLLAARGYTDALLDREYQPRLIKRLQAAGWKILWQRRNSNAVLLRRQVVSPARRHLAFQSHTEELTG